jgi:hypothetical protein
MGSENDLVIFQRNTAARSVGELGPAFKTAYPDAGPVAGNDDLAIAILSEDVKPVPDPVPEAWYH